MDNNKSYNQYTEQVVLTATPGELLIMLYNAEIKNIKAAIICIKAKNTQAAHDKLMKAQDIINELIFSLDDTSEIAKELHALYAFIKNELVLANVSKDAERLEAILPIVTDLRDTWEKAKQIVEKSNNRTAK
jgi:flagellar protein FliS